MISFDGTGDYITTAAAFAELDTATIMWYVTPNDLTGNNRMLGTDTVWECRLAGSNLLHEFRQATQPTTSTVYVIGTEYHIACTFDGTNKGVYVDGIADVAPTPLPHGATGTDTVFHIGASSANTAESVNGLIEDVRIYNRVLTQKEIELVANGNGRDQLYDGLQHWWPCNFGADGATVTFEPDVIGKINMTTVVGAPIYVKSPRTFLG